MSYIYQVGISIVGCCISITLLKMFSPDGNTKKIVNIIIGAFIICTLFSPVIDMVNEIKDQVYSYDGNLANSEKAEEDYQQKVINLTSDNLTKSLSELLKSNDIKVKNIVLSLKKDKEGVITISKINIYIDEQSAGKKQKIISLTEENYNFTPEVIIDNG